MQLVEGPEISQYVAWIPHSLIYQHRKVRRYDRSRNLTETSQYSFRIQIIIT